MNKYDVFGLSQLIERGLAYKLEAIETAVNKLSPALEPITVVESFIFVVNTNNGELYRFRYSLNEGSVIFTDPQRFELDSDISRFDRKSKKIIRNIVESLAEGNEDEVEYQKAQWLAVQRQKRLLEKKLDLNIGTRSEYIKNAKAVVTEAVRNVRGAKSVLGKGRNKDLLYRLLSEESITINVERLSETTNNQPKSRQQLLLQKIVDARRKAKELNESPVFSEYAYNLFLGENVDESIDFIVDNYQELFTLSLSEQAEVFYKIIESKQIESPDLDRVIDCILKIGNAAIANSEIYESLNTLSTIVGATNGNYHERMQIIESELNVNSYSMNDVKVLGKVLENILSHPSELLAPEFVVECRKALMKIKNMMENSNIDDRCVSSIIHLVSQFYPQQIGESARSEEYQKMFMEKLKKYGVTSPAELSDEDKRRFFEEVDKAWVAKEESDGQKKKCDNKNADKTIYSEEIEPQTGFPYVVLKYLEEKKEEEDWEESEKEGEGEPMVLNDEDSEETIETLKRKIKKMDSETTQGEVEQAEAELKRLKRKFRGRKKEEIEEIEDELEAKKLIAK